jgi:type IV pilus assembly protein PilE
MDRAQNAVRHVKVRSHCAAGFTLIEVMIVVVIIGVLASIAYPSYRDHVAKSNRAAAQSYMMSLAAKQEQIMLDLRGYVAAANHTVLANAPIRLAVPAEVSRHYTVTVDNVNNTATPPTFRVNATPTGAQASDGTLQLTSTGTKIRLVNNVDKGW